MGGETSYDIDLALATDTKSHIRPLLIPDVFNLEKKESKVKGKIRSV
jgi:hypothetical protein